MFPFHCIFPNPVSHCYSHWSYIELYIWSAASSLVIIVFIGGSIIHLVIQEIIILWNKQIANDIANDIRGNKSKYFSHGASLVAQLVKNLPAGQKTRVWSLSWEDPLAKEMATHSSIFAWKISWREEPGGLQSMGSRRVRHDWVTNTYLLTLAMSLPHQASFFCCCLFVLFLKAHQD